MNDRQTRAAAAAIVVLAAVLRLAHANTEFWFDEIVTVIYFVRRPFVEVVGSYGLANNHVLNSVLVHLTAAWLGESPLAVRLPAIAFGVAGVWAFWFTACALWRREAALLGTLLFAVSYHHIYYSQSARGYSALIFFALVATGCAVSLTDGTIGNIRAVLGLTERPFSAPPPHDRRAATVSGVAAGVTILLNFLLTPVWGLEGAALGSAIGIIVRNILSSFVLHKATGIHSTALGRLRLQPLS